jgi:hypothetical protein
VHGNIDTLGIGENDSLCRRVSAPRAKNVINQGLFYLDWLLVTGRVAPRPASSRRRGAGTIDWSAPQCLHRRGLRGTTSTPFSRWGETLNSCGIADSARPARAGARARLVPQERRHVAAREVERCDEDRR